jgi:hypothetical protein
MLSHDDHKLLYGSFSLNLLQLYFFTGFLANWTGLVNINNGILVACVAFVYIRKERTASFFSPLIIMYGVLTALSLINHWRWMPEAGLPAGARTMPIVFLAMLACRQLASPGLFERAITMNALPFALLIPFGAYIERGRYYSYFLNENILGATLQFAFAVGLCTFWERRFKWKSLVALFASVSIMVLGARRSMLLYCVPSVFMVNASTRRISLSNLAMVAMTVLLLFGFLLPIMTQRLSTRFGGEFSMMEQFEGIVSGDIKEKSASDRRAFIVLAFESANRSWLGYGNANFPHVVRQYAVVNLPEAGHPHSGLAESLITGGYPGMALYLLMLLYLLKIGHHDTLMRICLIWLFLQVFLASNLNNRMLWPMLAIAERELQMNWGGRIKS